MELKITVDELQPNKSIKHKDGTTSYIRITDITFNNTKIVNNSLRGTVSVLDVTSNGFGQTTNFTIDMPVTFYFTKQGTIDEVAVSPTVTIDSSDVNVTNIQDTHRIAIGQYVKSELERKPKSVIIA